MPTPELDLRDFYDAAAVKQAKEQLKHDKAFQKSLKASPVETVDDLMITTKPLKYLGIELRASGVAKTRNTLADALRLVLHPRSMDGSPKGLRLSTHRKAFLQRFPEVDLALSDEALKELGPKTELAIQAAFAASPYGVAALPALKLLQKHIGLPPAIALQVLRKGLAAFKRSHRPGMSAHGWARARLTSFVMMGCTHYFPDHKLVAECPAKTHKFWSELKCLCLKREQCATPGKRTSANAGAPHRAVVHRKKGRT